MKKAICLTIMFLTSVTFAEDRVKKNKSEVVEAGLAYIEIVVERDLIDVHQMSFKLKAEFVFDLESRLSDKCMDFTVDDETEEGAAAEDVAETESAALYHVFNVTVEKNGLNTVEGSILGRCSF